MLRPARLLPALLLASGLALAGAGGGEAQEVRGRILSEADGSPLAGAYVVLVDPGGSVVRRTVSTAGGSFSLRAPRPGRYTVRAEHIGFHAAEAAVAFQPGQAAVVELRAPVRAIELEGLVAEADRECRVDPAVAVRLTELWDEVGKAFRVTALVEERGTYLMEVDRWRRRLDPQRLRVEEEERTARRGFHRGSPFVSLSPERLAEDGYIHGDPAGGHEYYGPDARVLTSRSFQETHCFGFTDDPPADGEPGWVGLRFQPRDRGAMDIEGTLWIDETTYEPRRLDYAYSRLPYPLETNALGGRVEFVRVPDGPWIVHRWRIRVPLARTRTVQPTPGAMPRMRYELAAVLEDGGEVLRVRPAGEREPIVLGSLGRIEGTVRLTTGEPVAGASVAVEGTALRTRADPGGRFVLQNVPQGRYTVAWSSPALDSLDLPGSSREIEVRAGDVSPLDAVLPPTGVALAERCTEPLDPEGTAVLWGRVTAPEGRVPDGTVVEVQWEVVERLRAYTSAPARAPSAARAERTGPGRGYVVQGSTATAAVPVQAGGAWMACGAPHREELRIRARRGADGARAGEPVRLSLAEGEVRSLDLPLPPDR